MLTALTVLLALELAALMRRGASGGARRLLPAAVGATVFLGLMTQYYFAIYAFLACLAAGTHLLRRRRLGEAGALAACALAGVDLFLLAWPAALTNLPAGRNPSIAMSGEGALYALLNVPRVARETLNVREDGNTGSARCDFSVAALGMGNHTFQAGDPH